MKHRNDNKLASDVEQKNGFYKTNGFISQHNCIDHKLMNGHDIHKNTQDRKHVSEQHTTTSVLDKLSGKVKNR